LSRAFERAVIGQDISEVLELISAQLYVRRDKREKRACQTCEAAVVRAPRGYKIVAVSEARRDEVSFYTQLDLPPQ
jgi:transposase